MNPAGFILRLLTFWSLLFVASSSAASLPASPAPSYIFDEAGWISPSAKSALNAQLQTYERETSSQLVVAIFPKIPEGEEMVDFSQRVFEHWKPGLAAKDNGVILFIFAADRKLRIHSGYGLEGVLPDARCKQIIEETITPLLRAGQREQAAIAGAQAIIAATKGEYKGTGRTQRDPEGTSIPIPLIIFAVFFIVFFIIPKIRSGTDLVITGRGSHHDPWGGGGFSGGGGGGFSGGGGSSGGGGASGSW